MPNTQTIHVPHLGGITAAYQTAGPIDPAKPTVILINSFTTSSELYQVLFANQTLTSVVNLLAIELLGHGQTRALKTAHWTYWDTAVMNLQVMEGLGVERAFVLGTSQGGWVTVRMALLAPDKMLGIMPLGSSLDSESARTRALGCWDPRDYLGAKIAEWGSDQAAPGFFPEDDYSNNLIDMGFGKDECPKETREYWVNEIRANYAGDEGRKRIRMAAINLRDRDGLHSRVSDVVCPVLWLQGTDDAAYSAANAKEEILLFTKSPDARLEIVEGGKHFLSASHPNEVSDFCIEFVNKYKSRLQ